LRQDLPLTYAYLTRFRDLLETRKGFAGWERAIQERYFYALLRVGPYTFSRYKVAWRYIARSFITAVIAPMQDPYLGETLPLPNEKVIYVGTDCREEAYYLCGILSSAPVRCCVTCYMNPTSISAHVLDKLHIPAFDPADSRHLFIAALCEEGHRASDPRCQDVVRQQLDRAVAALYGLTSADLDTVRSMLEKI
jgi:resitriction-modification protein tth111II